MSNTIPYYIYSNGKLKKVAFEEPVFLHENSLEWNSYLRSLPAIEVHEDLKKVWKEGERYYEGNSFQLKRNCYAPRGGSCELDLSTSNCECGYIAIPLPVEAEKTYPLTAKQIESIWEAAVQSQDSFLNSKGAAPDKATYLKAQFGIDLTDIKE